MPFDRGHEFDVYFATNRNMTGSNSKPSFASDFTRTAHIFTASDARG